MRNHIVLHILLFILLMLVYQCASAQDYVITNRGDSLSGEVKPLLHSAEERVQIETDGKKQTFSIFEVRAFTSRGDVYHPVKSENGYEFMKLLESGYLSLYAFQPPNQLRFDGLYIRKRDGEGMVVPNLGFKKYMADFLSDCEELSSQIREGGFGKKQIQELVSAYNHCVTRKSVQTERAASVRESLVAGVAAWDKLAEQVRSKDFSEKDDALEMIAEIRDKVNEGEKIPNFLVTGLKNALKDTGLEGQVEAALGEHTPVR